MRSYLTNTVVTVAVEIEPGVTGALVHPIVDVEAGLLARVPCLTPTWGKIKNKNKTELEYPYVYTLTINNIG